MGDTVLVAAIASIPATITAGAAWMAAARGRRTARETAATAATVAAAAADAAIVAATAAAQTAAVAATKAAEAAAAAAHGRDVTESLEKRFMGNGHGDVVHMLETIIERFDLHDLRHAADDSAFKELMALTIKPKPRPRKSPAA